MNFLANRRLPRDCTTLRFDAELVVLPSQSEVEREVAPSNVMHQHAGFEGVDTPIATTTDLATRHGYVLLNRRSFPESSGV